MVVLVEMIVPYSYKFGKDINNNGLCDVDLRNLRVIEGRISGFMKKEKVLISSCLLGECVRYDGKGGTLGQDFLNCLTRDFELVPFCPECAGGLPTPRPPAEILGGEGSDVLAGDAQVTTAGGDDVTVQFVVGARAALECCQKEQIAICVLKERSPSCGSGYIYDGSFNKTLRPGRGVTAALLASEGVNVFSDEEFERFSQLNSV